MKVAVKDIFHMRGYKTTCGSAYPPLVPSENSEVISALERAGISYYKCTLTPFSCGSLDYTLKQPDGLYYGASSSGCAKAILQENADAAIGSDTGGSIRLPAARANLYGFKPTYGAISRFGMVPLAEDLDTVSLMSKNVGSIRQLFKLLVAHNFRDPTAFKCEQFIDPSVNMSVLALGPFSQESSKILREAGLRLVDTEPLFLSTIDVKSLYYRKVCRAFYGHMTAYNGIHHYYPDNALFQKYQFFDWTENVDRFEPRVKQRLIEGQRLLACGLSVTDRDDKLVSDLEREVTNSYAEHILLCPISRGSCYVQQDQLLDETYLMLANLLRRPAIAIPVRGIVEGVQLIGPKGSDLVLLKLAEQLSALLNER